MANGSSGAGHPSVGSVRTGGGANIPAVAIPAGIPAIWYDGRNLDGLDNQFVSDGIGCTARRNLGTLGSAYDQGAGLNAGSTATVPPLIHVPAAANQINNSPAIRGTGTEFMTTTGKKFVGGGGLTKIFGPMVVVSVFRLTDLAGSYYLYTGFVAGQEVEMIFNFGGAGKIQVNNGVGGFADTGQVAVAGKWNLSYLFLNGATSYHILNGVQSANFNTNNVGFTGVVSLSQVGPGGSFWFKGDDFIHMRWLAKLGPIPNYNDVLALMTGTWNLGAFPQP